jgi:hypothetical protein
MNRFTGWRFALHAVNLLLCSAFVSFAGVMLWHILKPTQSFTDEQGSYIFLISFSSLLLYGFVDLLIRGHEDEYFIGGYTSPVRIVSHNPYGLVDLGMLEVMPHPLVETRPMLKKHQVASPDEFVIGNEYELVDECMNYVERIKLLLGPYTLGTYKDQWILYRDLDTGIVEESALCDLGVAPYESGAWHGKKYVLHVTHAEVKD